MRNQAPAHRRNLPDWFLRMLADDRDWLGRGNVVARTPIGIPRGSVEILLYKLLPSRQSVRTAHRAIMADCWLNRDGALRHRNNSNRRRRDEVRKSTRRPSFCLVTYFGSPPSFWRN